MRWNGLSIRINLDRLLFEKRATLTELAKRAGITIANLSILKTNEATAIHFSTLDPLCWELDCQHGDLIERFTEEKKME